MYDTLYVDVVVFKLFGYKTRWIQEMAREQDDGFEEDGMEVRSWESVDGNDWTWNRKNRRSARSFRRFEPPECSETKRTLLYTERNGNLSVCLHAGQITGQLQFAHDAHGHFANGITAWRLIGQFYWPT